jgi:hypothetical protein
MRDATREGALKEKCARLASEDVGALILRAEAGEMRFEHGKHGLCQLFVVSCPWSVV